MAYFLPKEKIIMYVEDIRFFGQRDISNLFKKYAIVTNKRLILSLSWFGIESLNPARSYWFSEKEYKKHKKFGAMCIKNYKTGKGFLFGSYIKLYMKVFIPYKIKLHTKYAKEIGRIIKSNKK